MLSTYQQGTDTLASSERGTAAAAKKPSATLDNDDGNDAAAVAVAEAAAARGCEACRVSGTVGLGGAAVYVAAQLPHVPRAARLHRAMLVAMSAGLGAAAALRWRS